MFCNVFKWFTCSDTLVNIIFIPSLAYAVFFFSFLPMTGEGLFICFQLPARQEPVLDSSKYTAADVRIVSPVFFYLIYLSIYFLLKVTTRIICYIVLPCHMGSTHKCCSGTFGICYTSVVRFCDHGCTCDSLFSSLSSKYSN